MKKYLIIASAAFLALAACNKEPVETPVIPDDTVSALTFVSARPQFDDTRTAWDGETSSVVWSADDKIKVGFTFGGNWWAQTMAYASGNTNPNDHIKFYQSSEVSIDDSDGCLGTFTVPSTFEGPEGRGSFVFYAIYPAALIGNNLDTAPSANVTLKTNQTPASNSFDASTDIMVATSNAITSTGLPSDPIELNWNRVVAHANLTFSNMAFEGTEVPNKITLTFNEDAKVAGAFSVNMADGTVGTGSANEIVLEGNGLTVDGSNIVTWASVLPVSFSSLNVEIKTDKATYVRSITGLNKTFKKNARNVLTVNMATAQRSATEQFSWVKKDLSEITASDVFVIVGNNGSNYAMNHTSLNPKGAPNATAVTVRGTRLATSPIDAIQWNLSKDSNGYMFYPNGNTSIWLNLTSDNNGLRVSNSSTNGKYWSLDTETGYLKGTDTKDATRYLGVYQSTDWRSYTSTGTNIANQTFAFYVKTVGGGSDTPENYTVTWSSPSETGCSISVSANGSAINSGAEVASGTEVTIVATAGTGFLFDGWTVTGATVDDASASTTTFTVEDSNVSISAAFKSNKGSAENPYTASEAIANATNTGVPNIYVKGIVCSEGTVSSGQVTYFISDDGTTANRFELYKGKYLNGASFTNDTNVKLGDFVVVKGTLKVYSKQAELDANNEIVTIVRAPKFSPDGGNFSTETQSVTISSDDAVIRYTTDGTIPTTSTGVVYTSAITISETTIIKAIAVKDGFSSGVVSKTFTKVNTGSSEANFVFNTDAGLSALGIAKPASGDGTALEGPYTLNGVTMSVTHASTDTRVYNSNGSIDLRIYKNGGSLTFAVGTGKVIKSIEMTGNATGSFTASVGTFASGTWSGSANSVTLTATNTGKINTITVTYE